jgi:hypothetical protein
MVNGCATGISEVEETGHNNEVEEARMTPRPGQTMVRLGGTGNGG